MPSVADFKKYLLGHIATYNSISFVMKNIFRICQIFEYFLTEYVDKHLPGRGPHVSSGAAAKKQKPPPELFQAINLLFDTFLLR